MQLDESIQVLSEKNLPSLHFAKENFELIKQVVTTMNDWENTYDFLDEAEEFYFYKNIRPTFIAQFIFRQKIVDWESKAPLKDDEKTNYYAEKHKEIKNKLNKLDYVRHYLKTEENILYSIATTPPITTNSFYSQNTSWRTCLQHCIPLAPYLSYQLQIEYLKSIYLDLQSLSIPPTKKLHWNRNTIDIAEFAISIYLTKAAGDETTTLKEITQALQQSFDIDFGHDPKKKWRDILKRKQEKARFLNELAYAIERSDTSNNKYDEDL